MARKRISTEENDQRLRDELGQLLDASEALAGAGADEEGLEALALGSVLLGRELVQGVIGESLASPPRALNAHRLARHLWELEVELHYAHAEPDLAVMQMAARDAISVLRISRSGPRSKRPKMNPQKKLLFEQLASKARPKDEEANRRRCEGEAVPAGDWGSVPDRLTVAKTLGRKDEYDIYYNVASLYAHPSFTTLDFSMVLGEGGVTRRDDADSGAADRASMALGFTRTSFSRLLRRAGEILSGRAPGAAEEVKTYMDAAGITETGVVGRS